MKRIMLDRHITPHTTGPSDACLKLQRDGWKLRSDWMDLGDDPFAAQLVRGDEVHDIVVGWNGDIDPLRWAEIPDGLLD
jgi:hypothetical protein